MCACALDTEAAEGGDFDAGDEGGVGAAAPLDALRDWFAEEFTAFLIEGEEAVGTVDHFHGGVKPLSTVSLCQERCVFAEIF